VHFVTVCLGPTIQRTLSLPVFQAGAVNRASAVRVDASGKGVNVSRVLAQSGASVVHITHSGGERREWFLQSCIADGFRVHAPQSESPMRSCITVLDTRRAMTTELIEPAEPVAPGTENAVREAYAEALDDAHTVIISGSIAPGYEESIFPDFVRQAKERGIRVIADYRGRSLIDTIPFLPDIIKPNLQEFAATFLSGADRNVDEHADDPELIAKVVGEMQRLQKGGITPVITRGALPSVHLVSGDAVFTPPERIVPVNTIGCGDAFTAGLALELSESGDLGKAVARGHHYAALNAMSEKPGTII